jgi:hypothetical protein
MIALHHYVSLRINIIYLYIMMQRYHIFIYIYYNKYYNSYYIENNTCAEIPDLFRVLYMIFHE